MTTLREICEAMCDVHSRIGVHPTRINMSPTVWDDLKSKMIEVQTGHPYQIFGMDIFIDEFRVGYEITDEQRLTFTKGAT
jgi:hypothetical protein